MYVCLHSSEYLFDMSDSGYSNISSVECFSISVLQNLVSSLHDSGIMNIQHMCLCLTCTFKMSQPNGSLQHARIIFSYFFRSTCCVKFEEIELHKDLHNERDTNFSHTTNISNQYHSTFIVIHSFMKECCKLTFPLCPVFVLALLHRPCTCLPDWKLLGKYAPS